MISIDFLRQFRIGQYALFDFAAAFVGIYFLAPLLSKLFLKLNVHIPKHNWLYLTLPIGVLVHILVGSITPLTRDLLDLHGHYLLKIVIVALVILGLRGVKIVRR